MKKTIIITDTTCDLNQDYIEKEQLVVLKIKAFVGEKNVTDLSDKDLFELVDASQTLPKTSAVNVIEFEETFEKYSKEGDVLYLGLGSGLSSTFSTAYLASQDFDNVYVVDSQNLSSGIGLLVRKACKFRAEGLSASEIKAKLEELVPQVRSQFAINTLEYLHMGGRCSGTAAFFGTMLNLKPIIKVINNKLEVAKKPIGFKKALKAMLEEVVSNAEKIDLDCISVTHCLADEDAEYLKAELGKVFDPSIITENRASIAISAHCGPRTIGILYILEK